ncbi:Rho guanine nucleotide exchange factor 17 164 kDa [Takifugu flavidus]|uniref:Rho guanine nucleotide exchange factor 17 164 kDa n=1 Tax=Takifugu flavidus TaxID=433684 RepID=A0A5C6PD47_9TELE|nr:Rho guanine nucleotide exchange factor 17 164 kDa [Takifugu flavidus]
MAESEGKKAAVYRSVSFKKLESWRSNRGEAQQKKSVDLEAAGVALPTKSGRAEEFWATRNVSVSRKVSKISATTAVLPTADPKKVVSTPFPSLSPSIRQLTEKFASSAGTRRSPPADGAPVTRGSSTLPRTRCSGGEGSRKSFHEDSSSFEDSDHKTAKSQSKRIKVKFGRGDDSGSESENKNEKRIFRRLSSDGSADSELKVRKPSGEKPVVTEGSTFYRMGSQAQDKPSTVVRRHLRGGSAKRSSSEQQLDVEGEKTERRQLTSDREVESDGGDFRWVRGQRTRPYYYYDDDEDDEKELMPRFCERYVQEARQVIQDICQMSSREDNDDDADVRRIESNLGDGSFQLTKTNEQKKAGMKLEEKARRDREAEFENTKGRDKHEGERENRESNRRDGQSVQLEKLNSRSTNYREKVKRQTGEAGRALSQVNSEENMFYDRSVDELSGHESSLTDEGIVTEPEMAPSNPLEKSFLDTESNPDPLELSRTFGMSSVNAPCEDISANDVSQSDPMPQRCCSIDEEGNNNFSSVDSNMLGSLLVKGGGGCSPESSRPGYKGSMSSDLSVYSDSVFRDDAVHDYSGVIRSIVDEPGAMDRLVMDDNGNNKVPKKKSFSDPSRRSDAPLLSKSNAQFKGQTGSTEPICELDQSGQIPPSSSEPILSEQGQVLWVSDPEPKRPPPTQPHHLANSKNEAKNVRSQSECSPSYHDEEDDETDKCDNEQEMHKFNFDIKLAGILSPRMIRRPYRKRPNRLAQCFPNEDPLESLAVCSEPQEDHSSQTNFSSPAAPQNLRPRPNHVRYTSEPATFIPISPPLQPLKELSCFRAGYPPESCNLIEAPGGEAPPLDDVTRKPPNHDVKQRCERPNETTKSGITEAGQQRKNSEDTVSIDTRQKTKARVEAL